MTDLPNSATDGRFPFGRRMQLAILVPDLDAALEVWTERLGVGPFVVFEQSLGNRHFIYRGERSPAEIALAISYIGDTQIELICQRNDAPTIYTEKRLQEPAAGLPHHMAFWPDDMNVAHRELTSRGFEEVASIRAPTGEIDVYYFASPPSLGLMLEIVPMNSARRVYFSKIKELCEQPSVGKRVMRFKDKNEFLASIEAGAR